MRVDWWVTSSSTGTQEIEESVVFSPSGWKRSIVLVESPEELELVEALQLIYGQEVNVHPMPGTTIQEVLEHYSVVFTTWDPTDRNRI